MLSFRSFHMPLRVSSMFRSRKRLGIWLAFLPLLGAILSAVAAEPPKQPAQQPPRPKPASQPSASPTPPAAPVTSQDVDKAIERGLEYLHRTQSPNGSWGDSTAFTSLSVMAFLSAGHVPGEGKYGEAVEKGVRWVMQRQQPNGLIHAGGGQGMYHHGISTIMLAEAAGMADGKLTEEIRKKLEKAVELILAAQAPHESGGPAGGWRYSIEPGDADLSVTGWQIMALRAAKNLGCDVPPETIDKAMAYVKRSYNPGRGGFHYVPSNSPRSVTLPCTATGILCLELCGKDRHHSPEALKAGDLILQSGTQENMIHGRGFFYYYIYYSSQAMFQLGGKYWDTFRPQMHQTLLKIQSSDGSWNGGEGQGPAYCTAMAILALTVEYRYLPIYQRGEEPTDK